ncbi:AGE family epimerase/isomerase [Massilia sp. IC2-476]|uniref:AGE family epimerase/isomerase n=1 Tax=Massilia sp. IC2-476 TaxID=2887199 RepID=UPI001D1297DC|nr:AGE family epimerase/isomerase [Massilia sp. IC2-476]MCC2973644.1 AGE family epimerase/isomerase [Massilia sp. IC2-476]
MDQTPDFFSPDVLTRHVAHTLAFYHPRALDPSGGFYHYFRDDGSIYERRARHLVSSTRFVFVYAKAWRHFQDPDYQRMVRHGVDFLRRAHRNPDTGGYAWQLDWDKGVATVRDADNHCYGLAFVLLAYAHALSAGVEEARAWILETFELMERHFWQEEHGLYADQASADWRVLDPYRGQNANMHACEALLAAFGATGNKTYLHRAELLARNITQRQAGRAGGMIWEHYQQDWQPDWEFNLHDKANLFRPWGYQPGHFTEWAKLLLQLEAQGQHLAGPRDWLLPAAQDLYAKALRHAWDARHGGLHYGFAPDGSVCDADKYFWVQAETLAAAALLGARTGAERYWVDYERLWRYCWAHFVDHEHGAWYRILTADNRKYSDEKSPAGKVDYHTMGACWDIIPALAQRRSSAQR